MDNQASQVDILERLRDCPVTNIGIREAGYWRNFPVETVMDDAATEIKKLRAELAQAKAREDALRNRIYYVLESRSGYGFLMDFECAQFNFTYAVADALRFENQRSAEIVGEYSGALSYGASRFDMVVVEHMDCGGPEVRAALEDGNGKV